MFKKNKEPFRLIRKARPEYIYLDYLNKTITITFQNDYPQKQRLFALSLCGYDFQRIYGMVDNDCKEPIAELAQTLVNAIYFE